MGSPTLKQKKILNYRRGQTWRNCGGCDHLVRLAGHKKPRCTLMGCLPGRAYRINPNNQCDQFINEEALARLGVAGGKFI